MCGASPVWASEIEPAPVSITKRHFPSMKHLGDITKINGVEIEPVDIATFGSPCQDLSVAGKRAGLKHESNGDDETTRSGLFIEAVRIIKEMRCKTNGEYPTFAVWENVPGAFSSNKGEDFRIVLEEMCKIKDSNAVIPRPDKGKWADAGCIVADGYSIAWRILDAQFWGVPQRRRRIYLVADFTGDSAGQILFEREGLPWDIATGRTEGQGIAEDAQRGACTASGFSYKASAGTGTIGFAKELAPSVLVQRQDVAALLPTYCLQGDIARGAHLGQNGKGVQENISYTLNTMDVPAVCAGFNGYKSSGADITYGEELSPTPESNMPSNVAVFDMTHANDVIRECGELSPTLQSRMGTGGNQVPLVQQYGDPCHPLAAGMHAPAIAIDCRNHCVNDVSGTLQAKENGGQSLNYINPVMTYAMQAIGEYKQSDVSSSCKSRDCKDATDLVTTNAVRRLTPTECERLQGYPDGWTELGADGKLISDSARYKALGNSLALPCAHFVISRIVDVMENAPAPLQR